VDTCLIAACVAGEGFAQIDKEPRRQSEEVKVLCNLLIPCHDSNVSRVGRALHER